MNKTWETLEEERYRAVKNLNWSTAKMTALDQAKMLKREKKDSFALRKEAAKYEIYERGVSEKAMASFGRKLRIQILAAPDSCATCKEQAGQAYTTKEALATMPIPHPDCSHKIGFCRCMWVVDLTSLEPPR